MSWNLLKKSIICNLSGGDNLMKLATNKEIINNWFAKEIKSCNWRLPEGLKDFYEYKKDSLISDRNLQQQILTPLIQDISLTPGNSNPLNMFLQQGMSFSEPQKERAFDSLKEEHFISVKNGESVDQFKVHDPEIISDEREDKYKFTMTCERIERAFKEEQGLCNFLDEIRTKFIESDDTQCYDWLEKLIDRALNSEVAPLQKTQEIYIPDIRDYHLDEKLCDLARKIIQNAVGILEFHSRLYNACSFKKACSLRDLIFIFNCRAQVLDEVMNMSPVYDAKNNLLKVKKFGEKNSDVIGLAMSKKAISVNDLKRTGGCIFDPSSLRMNIFFNIHQLSLFRPFETMIVFKAGTDDQINKTIEMQKDANKTKLEKEAEEKALKKSKSA